jgi:hypothetical protein
VRGDEIDDAALSAFIVVVLCRDEEEGGYRHELPSDDESHGMSADDEQYHSGHQGSPGQLQFPAILLMIARRPVSKTVYRPHAAYDENREKEECAQGIDSHKRSACRHPGEQEKTIVGLAHSKTSADHAGQGSQTDKERRQPLIPW